MGPQTRAATAAAVVTALAAAAAAAVGAVPFDLPVVAREFTPNDLPGTFTSAFKNDEACPTTVDFGDGSFNDRGVYEVPWANIRENGSPCSGSGSMRFFSRATALDEELLAEAGFPNLQDVINSSTPARTTLFSGLRQQNALVGWDGGAPRTCGSTTYPADTFYFFMSEAGTVDITINAIKTFIPSDQEGMFVASNGPVLCVLRSPKRVVNPTEPPAPPQSPTPKPVTTTAPSATLPPPRATAPPVIVGGGIGGGDGDGNGDGNGTPTPAAQQTPAATVAPGAPDSSPTPTPEEGGDDTSTGGDLDPSPSVDDDSECFPGDAEVELASGAMVRMTELRVGDEVATGGGAFSPVYVFTHRSATAAMTYVRLTAASGAMVTVTGGHYVHSPRGLVAAATVTEGDDLVLADGTSSRVVRVDSVTSSGLYNPQTLSGIIVVGGVKVSTYTTAVNPAVAAVALAPLRGLWAAGLAVPQSLVSCVEGSARWALTRLAPALGGAASIEL